MRIDRNEILTDWLKKYVRRPLGYCLIATLAAGAGSVALHAKDREKPKAGEAQKIAHKADDTVRTGAGEVQENKNLLEALEAAKSSHETLVKISGYNCTFVKQELIGKKPPLLKQSMNLKFRREPFSVYLKYNEPNPGRQVLFVEGRNDGKFYFREASGLISYMGTMSLAPNSSDAMKENRYPVTMIGMEKMLDVYLLDWEISKKHPETQVNIVVDAKVVGVDCKMYEVIHPQQREPFKFHKGRVYIDKKTNLPIRGEQYAFPIKAGKEPQLVEEYSYLDVKLVESPVEKDFDPKNEKYGLK